MMSGVVGRISSVMLALVLFATGCAKSGNDDDPGPGAEAGTSGTGGTDGAPVDVPKPTCLPGNCKCENGEIGTTTCEDAESCDCGACPPFSPSTATPFEPCGGSLEGTWLSRTYDLSGVVAYFSVSSIVDSTSIACPADLREVEAPSLRLSLKVNAPSEVQYKAPDLYATVLESCIQEGLARSCEQIPTCSNTGCGTCGCGLLASDFSSDSVTWGETATTLTIGPLSFDYCVQGEVLTLRNRDNGLGFELERVVVPEQKCVGAPNECGLNETEKDCKAVRGCTPAGSCTGDAVRICNDLVDVCTVCPVGCECQFNLGQSQCVGTVHCADLTTPSDCAGLGCDWQSFVRCGGVADPCDSLTVAECRFTPGCSVK